MAREAGHPSDVLLAGHGSFIGCGTSLLEFVGILIIYKGVRTRENSMLISTTWVVFALHRDGGVSRARQDPQTRPAPKRLYNKSGPALFLLSEVGSSHEHT
ncbi:hypothetical protein AV530_000920 [Patagioenas fasciata monilis]|uniref:Uncharacterized protein n=1 Tax=Patagioenas fasciata monilis TaxID=372326 RepID=A0A1V4KSP2_PATFA|nr:hypothetical protein AV530_000920 [Patagioenas fasciata monilis]